MVRFMDLANDACSTLEYIWLKGYKKELEILVGNEAQEENMNQILQKTGRKGIGGLPNNAC